MIQSYTCSGRFSDHNYGPKVQKSWFWTRNKGFLMFLGFLGFRFSELFSKKSIPHGSSGQTAMWKRIPYGSSSFQVFIKKCRKYLFLPIRFHFFMITLFSPFVRLRPVQAGFCVSSQTLPCKNRSCPCNNRSCPCPVIIRSSKLFKWESCSDCSANYRHSPSKQPHAGKHRQKHTHTNKQENI